MPKNKVLVPFQETDHDHTQCVDHAVAAAETACAQRGLRLTPLRRQVFELIWRRHAPIKAYEILEDLREQRRSAAPPTVYRALDFLLEEGLIHRIESLNAYIGCGDPGSTHTGQFLICRHCGAVAELNDPEVAQTLQKQANRLGFSVDRETIEIKGLCPACRNQDNTETNTD